MTQNSYLQLVEPLAAGIGIDTSTLSVKNFKETTALLYIGQTGPEIIGLKTKNIDSLQLYLPYTEGHNPQVPFSQSALGDFKIDCTIVHYDRDVIPNFDEVVQELRMKNIPIGEISRVYELAINRLGDNILSGRASYVFGTPPLEKLCIEVNAKQSHLVPDAKEQQDQGHYCIHGDYAPFIPFNSPEFSNISIELIVARNSRDTYLRNFLDGVPVQQNLSLTVIGDDGVRIFRNPHSSQFEICIDHPETKRDVTKVLSFIRRLEEMFR